MSFEDVKKKVEEEVEKEVEKVEKLKDEVVEEVTGGGIGNLEKPAEVVDKKGNKHSDVL